MSTHTKSWLSHRLGTVGRWWQFPGSVVAVVTFGGSNSMKEAFVRLASHSAVLRTLQRFRNESVKKGCFRQAPPRRAVRCSSSDKMATEYHATTRPYQLVWKLIRMGPEYCRRHVVTFILREKEQNSCRQERKRRAVTYWIGQCQHQHVIHWIDQCQCQSAVHYGSDALSKGVLTHLLMEVSPVSSVPMPLSVGRCPSCAVSPRQQQPLS